MRSVVIAALLMVGCAAAEQEESTGIEADAMAFIASPSSIGYSVPNGATAVYPTVRAGDATYSVIENDEVSMNLFSDTGLVTAVTYDAFFQWIPIPQGVTLVSVNNQRASGEIVANVLWCMGGCNAQ